MFKIEKTVNNELKKYADAFIKLKEDIKKFNIEKYCHLRFEAID